MYLASRLKDRTAPLTGLGLLRYSYAPARYLQPSIVILEDVSLDEALRELVVDLTKSLLGVRRGDAGAGRTWRPGVAVRPPRLLGAELSRPNRRRAEPRRASRT
jgi:hypothetical protein